MTRDELIEELKKLPGNSELKFQATVVSNYEIQTQKIAFDRIIFSNPPVVEFIRK